MSLRILRLELRRSAAPFAALAAAAAAALAVATYGGSASVLVGDGRSQLLVLIPVLLGLGAWQARRDRRSRTDELLAATPRPSGVRRTTLAAALGIGAALGFGVPLIAAMIHAWLTGVYVPAWMVPALVATLVHPIAAVWLGLAVGRLMPWVVTPPLLVVGGFLGLVTLTVFTDPEGDADGRYPSAWLLAPGSSEGINAFERLTPPVLTAQVVWAVALAAASLLLFVPTRHLRGLAAVPIAAGLGGTLALLPPHLSAGVALDDGAIEEVCTSDAPRVCARRGAPLLLPYLVEPGREVLAVLRERLPQAPARVVAIYYGNDSQPGLPAPDPSVLHAEVYTDEAGRIEMTRDELTWTLLMGAGTLACPDVAPTEWERYATARVVAAAWLLGERPYAPESLDEDLGWVPPASVTHPVYDALRSLPRDEQRTRVAALREAELGCAEGDRLGLLLGDGA
ncbi:hypothetical protein [Georgenia alba]|uniref:ABC transporter permease n=1 Tax=Georgenia alba TaxID=2233858 RepID=A0ABW2QAA9_9MICO